MESDSPTKILYRIANPSRNKFRLFTTEISSEQLARFNKVPLGHYRLHYHDDEEAEFDDLNVYDLGSSDLSAIRSMVRVKSVVYGYIFCGIIMRLNLDDLGSQWERMRQPFCPHRWNPKLISLHDKLYVFGGIPTDLTIKIDYDSEPFGEVYDPEFDHWSSLSLPPTAQPTLLHLYFDSLLVVSLGETEGKILVYSPIKEDDSAIYLYDVDTQLWETHSGSVLDPVSVDNGTISGSEVVNEDDHMLYWLDRRTAFIYAFDWKQQLVYSGPITGLEGEHSFITKIREDNVVSLHHLSRDLFYLFWYSRIASDEVQESDVKSEIHFTVLRVVKHRSICALDAFVVGCLQDTVNGSYHTFDAVHI